MINHDFGNTDQSYEQFTLRERALLPYLSLLQGCVMRQSREPEKPETGK